MSCTRVVWRNHDISLSVSYLHNEFFIFSLHERPMRPWFIDTEKNLYIYFLDDEGARDRTFSYHRLCKKKKKKEKTAPMIKISWQSRDITWLSRFDEKNCLSGFTVTSTRTLSKRENLDNCEPRGEGLASRLPARTRIIVVLWWAPDTSLLSLRESLPLDSSLSLSFHSLVSLHGFRAFHAKFRTARVERLRFMITIRRS